MHADIVKYLLEMALTCADLARNCQHKATKQDITEIAIALAAKTEELERNYLATTVHSFMRQPSSV